MLVKPRTNFPIYGGRTTVIGTDPIMKLMKIKKINWPYRGTFQSSMETKETPIHEVYTVTFVEQPNFLSYDFCEDKWYHKRNA